MKYHSTRGDSELYTGAQAIVTGLCPDGGLFVPQTFPSLDAEQLRDMTYSDIAARILSLYLPEFSADFIKQSTTAAYGASRFGGCEGRMTRLDEQLTVLELWHGPTAAFKDYALQMLPLLLVEAKRLSGDSNTTLILVATSGDTGAAALEGFKGVDGTKVMVLYPDGGTSEVQEHQMLNVNDDNLRAFAVTGNFDMAQTAVKNIFNDADIAQRLAQSDVVLSSANSMNLGRLLPQICYYYSSYVEMLVEGSVSSGETVDFVVPTGNFGDILAGYYAKMMGLPVGKLVCASNQNRILTDFFTTGVYDANREFYKTDSPSMDILISSNLERLLYHVSGDCETVRELMQFLAKHRRFVVEGDLLSELQALIHVDCADAKATKAAIADCNKRYHYLIDTHTAVAYSVAQRYMAAQKETSQQVIVLSTASAYKFSAVTFAALTESERYLSEKDASAHLLSCFPQQRVPSCLQNISAHDNEKTVIAVEAVADNLFEFVK